MMNKDQVFDFVGENKYVIVQAAYLAVTALFLTTLGLYNNELNSRFGGLTFDDVLTRTVDAVHTARGILEYRNYSAPVYFIVGLILCAIGIGFIVFVIKSCREQRRYDPRPSSLIATIVCVLLTIVLIILILSLLNNPILMALIIFSLGVGSLYAATS